MIWPSPTNYSDWKAWAVQLLKILQRTDEKPVAKTRIYTVADVPPPIEDGMVIGVSDEIGGSTLAFSLNGEWLRVSDGAPIA